jgi:hypothetical protein
MRPNDERDHPDSDSDLQAWMAAHHNSALRRSKQLADTSNSDPEGSYAAEPAQPRF